LNPTPTGAASAAGCNDANYALAQSRAISFGRFGTKIQSIAFEICDDATSLTKKKQLNKAF